MEYGWLAAGCGAYAGEAGGARNNLQHVAGITEAAKETQPDAYIVGEHFGDARQWLQADVEDAAMNYRGFTFPLWGFLANTDISYDPQQIDAQTCMAGWIITAQGFLINNNYVCLISSTATILRDLKRCSVGMLRACPWRWSGCSRHGVPCIYYGDEVGLDGKNDPFCRKPFPGRWKSRIRRYSRCTSE